MAESAVSFVLQKLADVLIREAYFLGDIRAQLERLQDELRQMQGFLKDADAKQENDESVRSWVSNIRNVAYDVENLIDTFILRVKHQQRRGFAKRYACIFKDWIDFYCIGKKIETIQVRIHDISRRRDTYGIRNIREGPSSTTSERLRDLRRSSPYGLEKDIVGLGTDLAKLVAQLVNKEDRLSVISIVGMGGAGKTTLAKKVYNHVDVRAHFDCCAWVFVSQDCRSRDILQGIIRQVTTPIKKLEKLEMEELERMLYEHLQSKCYLVVLDDIWTKDAWDCLARAFPNTSNASRLMITTRNREVALYADARSIPHTLQLLSEGDSWELFCRKTFMGTLDASCPLELEGIGKKILAKCGGLPLGIIIIGGLLSRRKKLLSEWESVLDNISSYFARGETGVSPILALSYNDLPYYLKSCFLYLAQFPKDHVIDTHKLLQLWLAEGLIPKQGQRMESTAEDCLNDLIDRNMVQAVRMSVNERVMECKIHDLLRELSISKAKEESFVEIYENKDISLLAQSRHLAIHSNGDKYIKSQSSTPHLRSLIVFDTHFQLDIKIVCKSFHLLRVLDLWNSQAGHLPPEIGKLINLRYLSLKKTAIDKLPLSMRYLQSLQTLDIRDAHLKKIPNIISKMENLRHLYMRPFKGVNGQLKIDTLRHLQTLSQINVDNWKGNNSKMLINLRKLKVVAESTTDLPKFFNSIAELEHLSSLYLQATSFDSPFPCLTGISSLHRLTKLHIVTMYGKQTNIMHGFPQNLLQFTLSYSNLHQIQMEELEKLPTLSILRLIRCNVEQKELSFSGNGFSELKILILDSGDFEKLRVEEGAMPRLKRLRISRCLDLISLPLGIKFLSALQELEINEMPQSFEDMVRGEDSYKVHHIPSLIFTNTILH